MMDDLAVSGINLSGGGSEDTEDGVKGPVVANKSALVVRARVRERAEERHGHGVQVEGGAKESFWGCSCSLGGVGSSCSAFVLHNWTVRTSAGCVGGERLGRDTVLEC